MQSIPMWSLHCTKFVRMKPAACSVSLLTYIIRYKNPEDINMVIMKHGVTQKSDCPQLWTKVIETLPPPSPPKKLFPWTREISNLQIWHFDPLTAFPCGNHMKVSSECMSTLRRGRGGFGYRQKICFFNYRRMSTECVCFALVCQFFCPWS